MVGVQVKIDPKYQLSTIIPLNASKSVPVGIKLRIGYGLVVVFLVGRIPTPLISPLSSCLCLPLLISSNCSSPSPFPPGLLLLLCIIFIFTFICSLPLSLSSCKRFALRRASAIRTGSWSPNWTRPLLNVTIPKPPLESSGMAKPGP